MGTHMSGSSTVKPVEQRCRCASCDRDVRRNIPAAFVAVRFKTVKTIPSGNRKTKLTDMALVCSELCAHRLMRSGGWEFQALSLWVGPQAFTQYEDLLATYWVDKDLAKQVLPALLHALTIPPRPTVRSIRPEIRDIIYEAKEVLGQ